jgi:hypothetical protein
MFGYVVAAACDFARSAMPNTSSSATPLIKVVPTFLFRIIFPPENGFVARECFSAQRSFAAPLNFFCSFVFSWRRLQAGQVARLHYSDERRERNSTEREEKFLFFFCAGKEGP